jgi:cytidyltransferase-like protein
MYTKKRKEKRLKVVLIQGAFEIINHGHVLALRRASQLGDKLIVALNTNQLIRKYKKREPVLPWAHKKLILENLRCVDKVVPAHKFSPLDLLKKYDVDVYVLTREWEAGKSEEIAYMKSKGRRVFFSRRYAGVVPTSEIKRRLLEEAQGEK